MAESGNQFNQKVPRYARGLHKVMLSSTNDKAALILHLKGASEGWLGDLEGNRTSTSKTFVGHSAVRKDRPRCGHLRFRDLTMPMKDDGTSPSYSQLDRPSTL
eukprot:COSAG01_NODE_362_length_18130_cov_34.672307_14_plen_103_part_00